MEMTTLSSRAAASAAAANATLLSVVLDRAALEPLGRQLYLRIRDLILQEQLAGDARLPSSRKLAIELNVSRTVTLAAYDQLSAEGYLESRRGSGHYVRALNRRAPGVVQRVRPERAPAAISESEIKAPTSRGRPFDPDAPASALFPVRTWAKLMARGWRREGEAAAGFDDWAGLPSLRTAIAGYLRALQGLDCTAEHVLVTGGNADALQLITRALGSPGARIWVEDPGHVGARQTLRREGLAVVPVPVDAEGLDVAAGRRLAPEARFALVTPSRQFPSGAPLSLPRRVALIDWARDTGAIVIADDYDSELRFAGRPIAPLSSLDQGGTVLAIGGFSKVTFPGLRLGYIVGAPSLIARLIQARAREGTPVATAAQPALAEFIAGGGLARHLRALRQRMGARRLALAAALEARLGDRLTVSPQEVGMHLAAVLNAPLRGWESDVAFAAFAATRGLDLDPLSIHAGVAEGRQGFLLGYAAWDEQGLTGGVEILATLLAEER
jgi:GntR family transcriptional regulator/MocR family aminotransferase